MSHNPQPRPGAQDPPTYSASFSLSDDHTRIHAASNDLLKAVADLGYNTASQFAIRLAFEEAILNGLRHGHKALTSTPVQIEWQADQNTITMNITDQGPGFDPKGVPDPTDPDRIELPSGRGLLLMRAYMSTVEYNDKGNSVRLVYTRPSD